MADAGAPPKSEAEIQQELRAKERDLANEARRGGAAVYELDPNASPEEKASQVKKTIPSGALVTKDKLATLAKGKGTAAGTVGNRETNGALRPNQSGSQSTVNGRPKAGEGDWDRVGWEPQFGELNESLGLDDAIASADHQTFLESNLPDKFFGDWYHNAGVIGFACISTWFLTLIGGGLGWVFIVMACCTTYYRTSIRRVRRNIHDNLTRESAKARLTTDVESLEWMNSFIVKFWPIYQPVLAAKIIAQVDQVLVGATPGFLDSMSLKSCTFGTKPPRIEFVKTYPKTENDTLEMDWSLSFTPNDTADLTSRQLVDKVNPKIVLEVRVGKGLASKGLPIVVEDMAFSGTMRVKIKLQIAFPHIEKIDVCFTEKPTFDFVLKPLGGETFGVDIGFLPGLSGFIQEQIHGALGPSFYAPNIFTVSVASMLAGVPVDTAIGVLVVTIHNAQGLKNPDNFSGTPDPYTTFSIGNREEIAKTKIVTENANPRWNETKYILINNFTDSLAMTIFDFNEFRKDKELGVASFPFDRLQETPEQENVIIPVMANGKPRGQVSCDFRFFPVLEGKVLEDGTKEPPPESNTGVVRFTISRAEGLDASKSLVGQLSPYAIQQLNGKTINTTNPVKRKNSPIWEVSKEVLVTNRKTAKLGLIIKDNRDLAADPELGAYHIKLDTLLDLTAKGNNWFNLSNAKSGKVNMSAQWKPVSIKGILGGTGGYVTPIGVMRVHLQSAKDLRNLETMGKSDPYVHILLSGVEKGRTVTFNNDLNPKWNEVLYVPIHSPRERLTLEVMDQENMGRDRSLGHVEVNCEEYVKQGEDGLWVEHSKRLNKSEGLRLDRKVKGTLNFTISFYPCLNIADQEEEEEERKMQEEEAEGVEREKAAEKKTGKTAVDLENEKSKAEIEENALVSTVATDSDTDDDGEKKPPKIKLAPAELLKYFSGLLIFKIIEGQLAHKDCYLEVLMDDMLFPAYSTSRIKSKNIKFDEIGDAFVRELEYSKVTLRLREHGKDVEQEDEILGKLTGNTLETIKRCLNNPTVLSLRGRDGDVSKIKISLKYIPVLMQLDPSESINNMGNLRVDVLDAANLIAADRNGKSDPFCIFTLDGKEVHKTEFQKKTLHPSWNEVFETKIASRTAANFVVEVLDWDMGSKADFLGKAQIDLAQLEPYTPKTIVLKLTGKQGQEGKFGEIRLRLLFTASYITRSRQGSSTFQGTFATPGKIVTGVAGAPLKVGGLAVGGLTKGASFLKKSAFGRKSKESNNVMEETDAEMQASSSAAANGSGVKGSSKSAVAAFDPDGNEVAVDGAEDILDSGQRTPSKQRTVSDAAAAAAAAGGSPHNRNRSVSSTLSVPGGAPAGAADHGTATVKIVSASGFPTNANVQLRFKTVDKGKDLHKSKPVKSSSGELSWDESFSFNCTADQQFRVYAKDSHHILRGEDLGDSLFVVDDTGSGGDTVLSVGQGKVVLRTSFKSSETASNASPKHRRGLLKVRSHAS